MSLPEVIRLTDSVTITRLPDGKFRAVAENGTECIALTLAHVLHGLKYALQNRCGAW